MGITTLGLVLGYKCNLRCKSCLWGDQLDDTTAMSEDDACRYIEQAAQLGSIRMVGFTGGEPTLFKRVLKKAMVYASSHHGIPSAISTNCSWATTPTKADRFLYGYYDLGMRRLQVSIDDFHEEWMPAERVGFAVKAAMKLGMKSTMICVTTKNSKRVDEFLPMLGLQRGPLLDAYDAPCTPIGYAAERIPKTEFEMKEGVPADFCSMLDVLNVLPDGSLQLCCGAPFHINSLKAGNLKSENLLEIVAEAEWDPVFNSLSVNVGPCELAQILRREGKGDRLREKYSTACDACHHIFTDPNVRTWLTAQLEEKRPELFVNSAIIKSLREENAEKEELVLY